MSVALFHSLALFLKLVIGICWTWVYIEAIRIGFQRKTYCVPAFAIGLNFTWEANAMYVGLSTTPTFTLATVVYSCWLITDVFVLLTWLLYGRKYWPPRLGLKAFYIWAALVLIVSFSLQRVFLREFGAGLGATYAAMLQNLLMSVLFIDMLWRRKGAEGQSLTIAVNKMLGTLATTIAYGPLRGMMFVTVVGTLCAVVDLIYIGLLMRPELFRDRTEASEGQLESAPALGGGREHANVWASS